MKTLRMMGVLVVAGIGIGALLNAWLPNLDFGLGAGGLGFPSTAQPETQVVGVDEASPVEPVAEEPVAVPVIYVMIDGRDYLLRRGPEGQAAYKPTKLEDVIQAAQSSTGDDNGIRIRVEQRSNARELAERALRARLEDAGIPSDAVRWKDEPVN